VPVFARRSWRIGAAAAGLGALLAAGALLPARLERAVRSRIEAALARHGLRSRLDSVRVGLSPPLRLEGLRIERPGFGSLLVGRADVGLGLPGSGRLGRLRLVLGDATLEGPGGFSARLAPSAWNVEIVSPRVVRAVLRGPEPGLELAWDRAGRQHRLEARASTAPLGRLLAFRRGARPLLDAGVVDGWLLCEAGAEAVSCDGDLVGQGVRLGALENGDDESAFGLPADVSLRGSGSWRASDGAFELRQVRVSTDAGDLTGSLELRDAARDPTLALSLAVARVDFARLLEASGLSPPRAAAGTGRETARDLGSAALGVEVTGRLADPGSFEVVQRVEFTAPARALPALERLRGDFGHEVREPDGSLTSIDVSASSPDFIALAQVPPLFLRALLVAEDAGFFGHRGVDLRELPAAILTNWARGEPARGASTITQQLARNLFLTREKRLARKLHELCLALLLESRLGKQRILEIYLNVIEWGPRLHGLRPASRRYFGVEPAQLTPRQMAFLVALVPGPLKYQRSFADGTPSPGFLRLVDNVLAKLRSLDALDEGAYQQALAEPLLIEPVVEDPTSE
jgi:hypothetical protein